MWAIYVAPRQDGPFEDRIRAGARAARTAPASTLRGAARQDGLGSSAFFTPQFMVELPGVGLPASRGTNRFGAPCRSWALTGRSSTYRMDRRPPGKVHAKTGTWGSEDLLNDDGLYTKGLAGYMTTSHGRHIAFAFYINRMAGKPSVDPSKDGAHYAGQTLGEMATDVYEKL